MTSSWRRATWSCCTADFQVLGWLQTGLPRILSGCKTEDSSSTGTYFRMRPLKRRPRAVCLCLEPRFPLRGALKQLFKDRCSGSASSRPVGRRDTRGGYSFYHICPLCHGPSTDLKSETSSPSDRQL